MEGRLEFHREWVAAEAEREAMANAYLGEYFGCGYNDLPYYKKSFHDRMLEFLRIFLFDHKADFVPEGRNRWEYIIDMWKTSDAYYGLEDILGINAIFDKLDAEDARE
jgi:hypothetical protein